MTSGEPGQRLLYADPESALRPGRADAILVLSLWLARRWELAVSFWPRHKPRLPGVGIVVLYLILAQQQLLARLAATGVRPLDF